MPASNYAGDPLFAGYIADGRCGDDAQAEEACTPPGGYVSQGGDCDDTEAGVHPGAAEVPCDYVDNDCDGDLDGDDTDCAGDDDDDTVGDDDDDSADDDDDSTGGCECSAATPTRPALLPLILAAALFTVRRRPTATTGTRRRSTHMPAPAGRSRSTPATRTC